MNDTDRHYLHVIGLRFGNTADLKLVCHSPKDAGCYADVDESGNEIGRRITCNLVEWFENVGDEMIDDDLQGPPPWRVFADWGNGDYPVLTCNDPDEGSQDTGMPLRRAASTR